MKPIVANSAEGRVLLALRAGPMESSEFHERWPTAGTQPAAKLIGRGLVEKTGNTYRLTEAGRAACPMRNPLAAAGVVRPVTQPIEDSMPKEHIITRQQVLAAITEAGAAGTTPKALIERFDCADSVIYNHINMLSKTLPAVIYKPEKGRVCAVQFSGQLPARIVADGPAGTTKHATREAVLDWLQRRPLGTAAAPAAIADAIGCTEESTRAVLGGLYAGLKVERLEVGDDFSYFVGKLAAVKPEQPPVSDAGSASETAVLDVAPLDSAETSPPSQIERLAAAMQSAPGAAALAPAGFDDMEFTDPEAIEFGIWSNGALTMDDGSCTVQLSVGVTKKLRRFLGLFQEEA